MQVLATYTRNSNNFLLSPFVRERATVALAEANYSGLRVAAFECYRTPARQNYLYSSGRTTEGNIVTNAKAWESWHNYGLAIDIVFKNKNGWTWDGEWQKLASIMQCYSFEWPLGMSDAAHFQITNNVEIGTAREIVKNEGLPALWIHILEQK